MPVENATELVLGFENTPCVPYLGKSTYPQLGHGEHSAHPLRCVLFEAFPSSFLFQTFEKNSFPLISDFLDSWCRHPDRASPLLRAAEKMIRLGRPKPTSVSATGRLPMDLAPDAAWGAARIESWCALALEKEGSVVVVRQQLAAHPDDIDVNVVDPRGGWTALLIAWCVTPRPPPNLPAFAPLSSNNHRLWRSCIFPRSWLCPCVHHISPTSYLFHLLLSCAPYHRLPTACQPYIFFTTTPSLPVLALTSNPHSPPLPPSLPPSPPQFTRTLRGRCRAHRVRGECARAQLERPHPNVLRLKARPRGHRQDTCRCRCECQSASYPHYYSR